MVDSTTQIYAVLATLGRMSQLSSLEIAQAEANRVLVLEAGQEAAKPGRHLEDGQLRNRPEAVLHGPEDAVAVVPLPLEEEDDVDDVLERLRPGQGPLFGDMPDEKRRNVVLLGEPENRVCHLAHLADRPGA